uniref:Uncharacterized protein n=1 Tax=Alexandrium catenella TaxID=2925 RepID=A0A7S1MJZ3_ALECA|mmetsp:Transcript_28373/g.76829  ORF Transcript_28373/g.76829 Transcript_28373/m.76829 type:complete len:181 (+) Transcript_28373:65-607(+)
MAVRLALAVLSAGSALAHTCPGSGSYIHAKSETTVTVGKATCKAVQDEMLARVNGQESKAWHDPHNNGHYTLLSQGGSQLEFSRKTGNGQYTDKLTFTFEDEADGCKVSGCSESQVFSIADFSTNYCNLRMLYCGASDGCHPVTKDGQSFSVKETEVTSSFGASHDPSACLKTAATSFFA